MLNDSWLVILRKKSIQPECYIQQTNKHELRSKRV